MPTRNRARWIPQAIECFRRQTYRRRELLIVEDERDLAAALLPADLPIRYVFLEGVSTIGRKRNVAAKLAAGEIIVHWDDDDWSFPGRIEEQVAALMVPGVRVTGYHSMLFVDEVTGQAWQYRGPARYALGTSLAYWRAHWEANKFPDKMIGEDNDFVIRSRSALHSIDAEHRMVARSHEATTSAKFDGTNWYKVDRSLLPCLNSTSDVLTPIG